MTTLTETTETRPPASEPHTITLRQREQFDELCRRFIQHKAVVDAQDALLKTAKAETLVFVQTFGFVPTNAEKSKRFEGLEFVATRTQGQTTEIDDVHVVRLQLALSKAGCPELFPQLFTSRTEYTLQKGAGDLLELATLPRKSRNHILTIYAQCFVVRSKTPSLAVETLREVAERNAEAVAKLEKRLAKKGGK